MKPLLFLIILVTAVGCGGHVSKKNALKGAPASARGNVLVGEIERNDLLAPPHFRWFTSYYDRYNPGYESMEVIKTNINEFDSIRVFMGTWCIDSRMQVPKLFKILDESDFDLENVHITAMELNKTAPDNSQDSYGVVMIPTMIFYKDGHEVNRFVEYPRETFEEDLAKIVSGKDYKHSYLK